MVTDIGTVTDIGMVTDIDRVRKGGRDKERKVLERRTQRERY
jgi:hypothetical protein